MKYNIAMYTRLSIEDKNKPKNESESIVNQKSLIRNFIKNHYEFYESNVISYSDDGYVGSNFERPAFKKLIEDVKNKKINCIIVKDLSRFGRDYIKTSDYLDKIFPFLNIRFIAINDNYDSKKNKNITTDLDISFKNILYSYYSKDLSKKIKTGFEAKAKQGYYICGDAPFGYKKDDTKKTLVINPETAPIVEKIFMLAYEGHSHSKICKILNQEKIPTRCQFKNNKNNKNNMWRRNSILEIITNEVYIGNTISFKRKRIKCGNKKTIKNNPDNIIKICNTHKPIINKNIFYTINNKYKKNNSQNYIKPKNIFAYKIKCDCCRYSLKSYNIYQNNKIVDRRYRCVTKNFDTNNNCKNIVINESYLKKIVFEQIQNKHNLNLDEENIKKQTKQYKKQIEKLNLDKKLYYEDYLQNKINKQTYYEKKQQLDDSILKLQQNLTKTNNKNTPQYLTLDLVNKYINCIYISKNNKIKINWK